MSEKSFFVLLLLVWFIIRLKWLNLERSVKLSFQRVFWTEEKAVEKQDEKLDYLVGLIGHSPFSPQNHTLLLDSFFLCCMDCENKNMMLL